MEGLDPLDYRLQILDCLLMLIVDGRLQLIDLLPEHTAVLVGGYRTIVYGRLELGDGGVDQGTGPLGLPGHMHPLGEAQAFAACVLEP